MASNQNKEVLGDWSGIKGTEYHIVYALWLLLIQRASKVSFYAGNDLLASPVPPPISFQSTDTEDAIFIHSVLGDQDVWIQLKSTDLRWTLAAGISTETRDRFAIRLLQGCCAISLPGGLPYARNRFAECVPWLRAQLEELSSESENLKQEIANVEEMARPVPPPKYATNRQLDDFAATMTRAGFAQPRLKKLRHKFRMLEDRRSAIEVLLTALSDASAT